MVAGVQVQRALEVVPRLREPLRRPLHPTEPAQAHHAGGIGGQTAGVELPGPVHVAGGVELGLSPRGPYFGGPRRDVGGALEQRSRRRHASHLIFECKFRIICHLAAAAARAPRFHNRPRLKHAVILGVRGGGGGEDLARAVGIVQLPALQPRARQRHVRISRGPLSRGGEDLPRSLDVA